ncbi:hypothetical protein KSS94_15215 [Pseudomonas fakonensis]|uniref:Lipoprotein n=1 Tax=Pseudomonas fakonensis TaxID=2842355 RepID=A0ABX8MZX0_9PSED|nr:hypothetical protein [Pseudomonas fakonensis]QXH49304.1 hypothetical protein KSS94_15215 [Pseudomonas fakonensis]
MLRKVMLYGLVLLCTGCVKTARQPPAMLEFIDIHKDHRGDYSFLFSSNIDLFTIFDIPDIHSKSPPALICSFDGDMDFTGDHMIYAQAMGIVARTTDPAIYEAEMRFHYTHRNDKPAPLDSYEYYLALLQGGSAINCKVSVTYWGFKPYLSEVLTVPSALMLERFGQKAQ